jgi:hypothetical protein
MTTRYELVEWENLGYNLPQSLPYPRAKTIAEAAANIHSARTFVVAVENGVRRPLTEPEESEFQSAVRRTPRTERRGSPQFHNLVL